MPEVLQGGPAERSSGLPPGLRRVGLVLLLASALWVVSRSGLLSAEAPQPPDRPLAPTVAQAPEAVRLVGEVDGHLVRPGQDDWSEGPRLPGGSPGVPLLEVPSENGPGTLAGVTDGGVLFVVGTGPDAAAALMGRARAVVAATQGRLLVWRDDRVLELDAATGRTLDPVPFPGFDARAGWSPQGVVAVTGSHPLLMSRQLPDGQRQELALAWPARHVAAGNNPPVQTLGTFGVLLGIADDWVLAAGVGCPGTDCTVQVVSVIRDDVLVRDVYPPRGWVFDARIPGRTREALLPVRSVDETVQALARVVPGGERALLVGGTAGVDLEAGVVGTPDGDVYLIVRPAGGGSERLWSWRPDRPGGVEPVPGEAELPRTARLVCFCG